MWMVLALACRVERQNWVGGKNWHKGHPACLANKDWRAEDLNKVLDGRQYLKIRR